MKQPAVHVEVADWSRASDRAALEGIRRQVFVVEQGVPEARERDGLDAACLHVLARDEAGQPVGCARLSPERKIGRMAVLREWRGHGVGVALLRTLVQRARAAGWPAVTLAAQVSAIGFYAREGFVADGAVFDDAGLPHRAMSLTLAPPAVEADEPSPNSAAHPIDSGQAAATARLQILGDARRRLCLRLPALTGDSYASADELAQIKRVALSGRGAEIRILLHDPAAALRVSHRLVLLAQRLSSAVQVRVPTQDADLADLGACLLNDVGGYLFLPEADRPRGRTATCNRAAAAPLQKHFDDLWERAERARVLQVLNI